MPMGALPGRSDPARRARRNRYCIMRFAKTAGWALPVAIGVIVGDEPAFARLLHTRPGVSATWSPFLPLVIGGGLEAERDSEEGKFDFPLLIEYHFSEQLQVNIEPNIVHIIGRVPDVETVTALDDTETSVEWEFLKERRYRPSFTAEGVVRWPTAGSGVGSPGIDYTAGLILSKDMVFMDLDFNVAYTVIADKSERDSLEISLAGEIPLTHYVSIEAEVVQALGTGGVRGQPGTIGGLGPGASNSETEATIGVAWQVTRHLKFEHGIAVRSDRTWQAVFAWEYSFAGED